MINLLKPISHCVKKNIPLKTLSGYKTGGKADYLFEPDSIGLLCVGIEIFNENKIPYFVIGAGTNILIHDEGFRGVIINFSKHVFRFIELQKEFIKCGPGVTTKDLSSFALSQSIKGFEFLAGFPGTIGGAVYGNAGGIDIGICNLLECVQVVSNTSEIIAFEKSKFDYTYRNFPLVKNHIITEMYFKIEHGETTEILKKMDDIRLNRMSNDPKGFSCGSVFKNPPNKKAWQIIDNLGLRGYSIGDAEISTKHANWIINKGKATSSDIWHLIRIIQIQAKDKYGIDLELELKTLGDFTFMK